MATILKDFLPLQTHSKKAVTFYSIFKESRVEGYLEGPSSKVQQLQQGFANLFRRHPRLPRAIIRKIIPAAVEYRRFKRQPLTRDELDNLAEVLRELDSDMDSEISEVTLDATMPRIVVPPNALKERLRGHDLHPSISSDPLALFEAGHFNEAVRKAAERFEDRIRDISGLEAHGRDLMGKALGGRDLPDCGGIEPENEKDFREGYKFLGMGAMAAIRNVFSHGDEESRSPEECFEMLMFINWLFRRIPNHVGAGS